MGEICAVCGKGKGPEKCEVCGFSDHGSINRKFPVREDLQNWIDTVVKTYRIQWEAKKREAELLAQLGESRKREAELLARFEKLEKNIQTLTQAPPPAQKTEQTYKIGDRGPAGGVVFYDKGGIISCDSGTVWRYLEAAPDNLGEVAWSSNYIDSIPGTGIRIGSGKRNTEIIVKELNRRGESGAAAQLCKEYTLNGYDDWFLPSKDELNLLLKNLKKSNLRRLYNFVNGWYWSSSQADVNWGHDAWVQRFNGGFRKSRTYEKSYTFSVRAIRAF